MLCSYLMRSQPTISHRYTYVADYLPQPKRDLMSADLFPDETKGQEELLTSWSKRTGSVKALLV